MSESKHKLEDQKCPYCNGTDVSYSSAKDVFHCENKDCRAQWYYEGDEMVSKTLKEVEMEWFQKQIDDRIDYTQRRR